MIVDKILFPDANLTKGQKTAITIVEVIAGWQIYNSVADSIQARKNERAKAQAWQAWYAQGGQGGFPGMPAPGGTTPGNINMPAPGGGLSYAPATYDNLADAIENALTTGFAEDWTGVETTMKKLKTTDDYLALDNAFGSRSNYVFGIPKYTEGLAYWLNDEMAGSTQLKNINNYFSTQGIGIQF